MALLHPDQAVHILGLRKGKFGKRDLQHAYQRALFAHHPDKHGSGSSEDAVQMNRVIKARDTLKKELECQAECAARAPRQARLGSFSTGPWTQRVHEEAPPGPRRRPRPSWALDPEPPEPRAAPAQPAVRQPSSTLTNLLAELEALEAQEKKCGPRRRGRGGLYYTSVLPSI